MAVHVGGGDRRIPGVHCPASLACLASDPISKTRCVAPGKQHSRLSSGFCIYVHTYACTHAHEHTATFCVHYFSISQPSKLLLGLYQGLYYSLIYLISLMVLFSSTCCPILFFIFNFHFFRQGLTLLKLASNCLCSQGCP